MMPSGVSPGCTIRTVSPSAQVVAETSQLSLEAKGWVERRGQNGDRRVKRVYLTPEAERVHRRIWRVAEETVDDALASLSQREGAQLMRLLTRVKQSLVATVDGSAGHGAQRPSAQRQNGNVAP